MSNEIKVPTMSTRGWVSTVADKFDFLLAHMVESDADQDPIYGNRVSNLQSLVQKHSSDPHAMASAIQNMLVTYLSRYYSEKVEIETEVRPTKKDDGTLNENRVHIDFFITFKVNGVTYRAQQVLSTIDSKFHEFARVNNG